MAEKVLVAGAGGRLGRHLLKELAARGYGVRALVRDPCTMAGEDLLAFGVAVGTNDVVAPATARGASPNTSAGWPPARRKSDSPARLRR